MLISYLPGTHRVRQGLISWGLLDDLFLSRDRNGRLIDPDRQLTNMRKRWGPLEQVEKVTRFPFLMTVASLDDERTGPLQHLVFNYALRRKGIFDEVYLNIPEPIPGEPGSGHGTTARQDNSALGAIAKRYGITDLRPLQ